MDARQFVDLIGTGQNAEAKDALEELLATKAFDALESRKQEIATTLFNKQEEQQVETQNEE